MDVINIYTIAMSIVFVLGYFLITVEHVTKINKTSIALLIAIICWLIQFASPVKPFEQDYHEFTEHLAQISQIIFFLLGALTIVETISVHKGFSVITDAIKIESKRKLLWVIGFLTFFLSAVLDNLTTTVVMVSLLKKLVEESEDRLLLGGAIVIAANAGGAWTPIGDVTTTMLWIDGQISTIPTMRDLFLPSIACLVFSLLLIHGMLKGNFKLLKMSAEEQKIEPHSRLIFFLGLGLLIFVPIFKILTGLPPFMGMLFGVGVLWLVTDMLHCNHEREHLRIPNVLSKIDLSSTLFFLGILLCIDSLDTAGLLNRLAQFFDQIFGNTTIIAVIIGLASAVVDNVPLVAAAMGMYEMAQYPMDSNFWQLVAYCAGTGGSILIIGSAAGVVFMGLEKVSFGWFLKRISLPALVGYFMGVGVYLLLKG